MSPRALVVDDDESLRTMLNQYFQREGFAVSTAATGNEALRRFYEDRPDVVILDLMLPGMDGWEVCARLRELSDVPILLLSARTAQTDKLRGFRLGVDDYVAKPFSLAELVARVRAVLARSSRARQQPEQSFHWYDLRVDLAKRQVRLKNEIVPLTPTEFRLLVSLIQRKGAVVSEDELREEVWGRERLIDASALRRYIWLLRQKIEEDPSNPQRVLAVRGSGYRLGTGILGSLPEEETQEPGGT